MNLVINFLDVEFDEKDSLTEENVLDRGIKKFKCPLGFMRDVINMSLDNYKKQGGDCVIC